MSSQTRARQFTKRLGHHQRRRPAFSTRVRVCVVEILYPVNVEIL
jgi:hypothetical protein